MLHKGAAKSLGLLLVAGTVLGIGFAVPAEAGAIFGGSALQDSLTRTQPQDRQSENRSPSTSLSAKSGSTTPFPSYNAADGKGRAGPGARTAAAEVAAIINRFNQLSWPSKDDGGFASSEEASNRYISLNSDSKQGEVLLIDGEQLQEYNYSYYGSMLDGGSGLYVGWDLAFEYDYRYSYGRPDNGCDQILMGSGCSYLDTSIKRSRSGGELVR